MDYTYGMHELKIIRECLIDGKVVNYDVCSTQPLKEAIEFYKNWKHIGSGFTYLINGVENVSKDLRHFFIKTN